MDIEKCMDIDEIAGDVEEEVNNKGEDTHNLIVEELPVNSCVLDLKIDNHINVMVIEDVDEEFELIDEEPMVEIAEEKGIGSVTQVIDVLDPIEGKIKLWAFNDHHNVCVDVID